MNILRLQAEALDNYGDMEAFDLLLKQDGLVAWLGTKGMIQFESGGLTFRERLLHGYNTTIGHRGKNVAIPQTDDEGFTLAITPQALIDGSIVYNQQELDQVQGDPKIAPGLVADKTQQFQSTWIDQIAGALRQATPGANDPFTLLPSATTGTVNGILVARTPAQQVTDAATTAGISRSETTTTKDGDTIRLWANQYATTQRDVSTVSGRANLHAELYGPCTFGATKDYEPDFGLCGTLVLSGFGAAADNNRRGVTASDEAMAKFGYDTIKFYNSTLIRDASSRFTISSTRHKLALLNSRTLKLKVLNGAGGVKKEMLDTKNNLKSLPIFWKHKNMSDYASLNYNFVGYLTYNLVPKALHYNGLHDNITVA